MWTDHETYLEDLNTVASDSSIPWHLLEGKTVLVTGATGLVGSNVVNALLYQGMERGTGCRVVAPVRDISKAGAFFAASFWIVPSD